MPSTAKGFPSPASSDDNTNHAAIQAIADRYDTILTARTAAQIDALTGTDLWTGRRQRQTDGTGTTVRQQSGLYIRDAAAVWRAAIGDGLGGTGSTPALTGSVSNPAMGTSPTQNWDWWLLGSWVVGNIVHIWGTGSPTPGSGNLTTSLPVAPIADASVSSQLVMVGHGNIKDVSAGTSRRVALMWDPAGGAVATMRFQQGTTPVTGASPLTLGAAGDEIKLSLIYPIAAI